jgi:hypothetical protein
VLLALFNCCHCLEEGMRPVTHGSRIANGRAATG